MSIADEKLSLAETLADKNEPMHTTVREFIGWFGYERRGWRVVKDIRARLKKHNLVTVPDFDHLWFDGFTQLKRPDANVEDKATMSGEVTSTSAVAAQLSVTQACVGGAVEDPAFRIGKLAAANNRPVRISPTSTVREAITIMLRENYSQLPVMTTDRDVKGAITWQSIAKRTGLGHACTSVQECMDTYVEVVDEDDSLFRAIERIRENDFVLVRSNDRVIIGILTVADLSETLDELGRPFLLLSEIENHIRGLIDGKFTQEELKAAKNPGDADREVNDVSDLTFGEYVRLLQNPSNWDKLGLPIDRKTFIDDLQRINTIRNDVMHFDPDGIGEQDLDTLRKSARFIQELRDLKISQ